MMIAMEDSSSSSSTLPLAKLTAIEFGLATAKEISKISVYGVSSIQHPSQLSSARLGLPVKSSKCESCGTDKLDECEGHFGHIRLPTPIYHPSHVAEVKRILSRICLNCFELKKKTKSRHSLKEMVQDGDQMAIYDKYNIEDVKVSDLKSFNDELSWRKDGHNVVFKDDATFASINVKEEPQDFAIPMPTFGGNHVAFKIHESKGSKNLKNTKDPRDLVTSVPSFGGNHMAFNKHRESKAAKNLKTSKEPPDLVVTEPLNGDNKFLKKQKRGKPSKDLKNKGNYGGMLEASDSGKQQPKQCISKKGLNSDSQRKTVCPYCQVSSIEGTEPYPNVIVSMVQKPEGIKIIELKISSKKSIPLGFWSFLERYGYPSFDGSSRTLLPFEAMKILEQLSDKTLKKLGRDASIKNPGALILECIPVPPNCVRIPDQWGNMSRIPSDHATQILKKIVTVAEEIRESRCGRANFKSHEAEAKELQSLCTQYLRVRGAPKVPGSEEPSFNFPGQVKTSNGSFSKIWLEKIRSFFLKKSCGSSSRSVIIGDAYRGIDEIGIPVEIANRVTFEERVNAYNREKLQKVVDKGLCRTFVDKGGKYCSNEIGKAVKKVEIGEVINRRLQDGDVVFINRPPSTHKHSLQALKTYIHPGHSVIINPLICGSLGADFDGDCIHVFYPQSPESRAELTELLSVDQQFLSSHGGEQNITLTVDTKLAARLLFASSILNRTTMHQLSMWTSSGLPEPALVKMHQGSPSWTVCQIFQMALPRGLSSTGNGFSIVDSEILSFNSSKMQLKSSITKILDAIVQEKGLKEAVKFLNSVECFLVEWLSLEGFSVGLEDLVVASDFTRRKEIMKEIRHKLDEGFPCMKHMRGESGENIAVSQLQNSLLEMQERVMKCITNTSSLVSMVDNGDIRSTSKVVQQLGFVGLQLFQGKKAFPNEWSNRLSSHLPCNRSHTFELYGENDSSEVHGFVKSSFVDGLNPCESFIHSLSSREGLLCQKMGLKDPGILFKNLMAFLRDLIICYDGTVRNACGKFLVQFHYGSKNSLEATECSSNQGGYDASLGASPAGEPVGILAATAIAYPAYKGLLDSAQNNLSPWDILQETLTSRYNSALRPNDRRIILHLKDDVRCEEKAALIQEELMKIPLKTFAVYIVIEYQKDWQGSLIRAPLVGHIQLNKKLLQETKLSLADLICKLNNRIKEKGHPLNTLFDKLILHTCEFCNVAKKYGGKDFTMPCLHFALRNDDNLIRNDVLLYEDNTLDTMVNKIYPKILETTIKGDDRIETVKISWNHVGSASWVPRSMHPIKNEKGEIMVEVVVEAKEVKQHGDAWRIVFDACLSFMHLLDARRCIPYSIHEAYKLLGIPTAYQLIVQRLSVPLKTIGKGVFREHLLLVSDCMTYTGNILGFNPAGYRDFYRCMRFPVPFTEGTLRMPIKCFEGAAERGEKDTISGAVASCSWGKRAHVGTGSDFEILWHDIQEVKGPRAEQQEQVDVCDFFDIVGMAPCRKDLSSSLCLGTDFDDLNCVANLPIEEEVDEKKIFTPNCNSPVKSSIEMDGWGCSLQKDQNKDLNVHNGWGPDEDDNGKKTFTSNWDSSPKSLIQTNGWESSLGKDQNQYLNVHNDTQSNGWGPEEAKKTSTSNWNSSAKSMVQINGWECSSRKDQNQEVNIHNDTQNSGWGPEEDDNGKKTLTSNWDSSLKSLIQTNGWECSSGKDQNQELNAHNDTQNNGWGPEEDDSRKKTFTSNWNSSPKSLIQTNGWGCSFGKDQNQDLSKHNETQNKGWSTDSGTRPEENVDAKKTFTSNWESPVEPLIQTNGWGCPLQKDQNLNVHREMPNNGWNADCQPLPREDDTLKKTFTSNWDFPAKPPIKKDSWGCSLQNDQTQEADVHNEIQTNECSVDCRLSNIESCWEEASKESGEAQNTVSNQWANADKDGQNKACSNALEGNFWETKKIDNLETTTVSVQNTGDHNCSDWEKNQNKEQLALNDGWNSNPKGSTITSGWGDVLSSEQQTSGVNNAHPTQSSWELPEQNWESSRKEQFRSKRRHFGHKHSNDAFKFKPSGANTVPLGERRPFSQNVPEHELNAHTQTEIDMQSADCRALAGGSSWGEPSKETGVHNYGVWEKNQQQEGLVPNDGWNPSPDVTTGKSGWDGDWNACPTQSSGELNEHNLESSNNEQGRSHRSHFGREMSNNAFKFKPSGANTVPLGERRPFSQNVPEHISNVYTQTQNDGQSTDSRLLAGGSCWDDLSKDTGETHNNSWSEWPNAERDENTGNDIPNKLSVEPCNDGWNPCMSAVKSGWDADCNAQVTPCSWDASAVTSAGADGEAALCAGQNLRKEKLSMSSADLEGSSGQKFDGKSHDEQCNNRSQGRGRGRGRHTGERPYQFTANRKRLDQFVPEEEEILKEVEPLMRSMRRILHPNRYKDGDRLTAEDETEVIEKVLSHHPEKETKIGDGIDSIMIDNHSVFKTSRCFYLVRKDGSKSDFSYLKCLKQLVQEKFPTSAQTFIDKYFSR